MTDPGAYIPLARHGIIGDLHTAALIDDTGSVSWYCAPSFDSPSLFAALLDTTRGGRWRVAPQGGGAGVQRYEPDTNVLETRFVLTGGTEFAVTDFMPVAGARGRFSELHRVITCASGPVDVQVRFEPRFDYATKVVSWQRRGAGWLATDDEDDVVTLAGPAGIEWAQVEGGLTGRLQLRTGERAALVLRFDDDEVHAFTEYETDRKLVETLTWWRNWANRATYAGTYDAHVRRSLLALKLCCFEPTGATVAAPTTSLPEVPGGTRNWDYRFMWLRDSAFVLFALDRSGYTDEVEAFTHFIKRLCRRADGPRVHTMYRLDGRRDMPEIELSHLEGYGGARPVRVGNEAAQQYQMDVYGEVLEILYARHRRSPLTEGIWNAVRVLVASICTKWREPDWSIWEAREEPRQFVFSKMMAWTALDRGARIATALGHDADAKRWRAEAETLHADVFAHGWDSARGTFVQAYDAPELDAAVLVAPKVGFLRRSDPRVRSTVDAVRRELGSTHEELIYRYRRPDGLPGTEGAFVICSFWVVQALAMSGDVDEADRLFRKLLARATPLGLYGEQIDPETGAHLGNFPQAFSHAALINTAHILEQTRARLGSATRAAPQPDPAGHAGSAAETGS